MTKPIHNWRDPAVIQRLREMSRVGFTDRAIAWAFGYSSPAALLNALRYPGCEEAVIALTEGHIEAEIELINNARAHLASGNTSAEAGARKWLGDRLEKRWINQPERAEEPKAIDTPAFTDAELLATLRPERIQ